MDAKEIKGKRICHNCRWYDDRWEKGDGLCRANPPRIFNSPESDQHGSAWWPVVEWDDWCSSFTEKETEANGPWTRPPAPTMLGE